MDAWALTDHGNGNGHAHARAAAAKTQKSGKKYRQLYGVEFYFVPSLAQWKIDFEAHKQSVKDAKTAAEAEKKAKIRTDIDADEVEEEEAGGHVVEDEAETKADDYKEKPDWQRRYHLVAVAQNKEGMANIYRLVKASFKDGFYRYPRIDFDLLRKYGKGIVWSSACLGGIFSGAILRGEAYGKSSEEIIAQLSNLTDRFTDAVGTDNFFLEIQFNKLPKQHTVNKYLIDLSRKTGVKLIATCDSHYPDPSKWQARELYKKLGWMGQKLDGNALPKFEDLKCELYPKNATQMWDEFKASHSEYEFYKGAEEEVRDAIERTHDIAWQMCEDVWIDTKAKLPKLDEPGNSTFQQLTRLVKEGLDREGLADKPEYVKRAKMELSDIKFLGHASYFVTMYKIFHRAETRTLLGPGRGSGPSSLVNFLLGITQFDPIQYNLLWGRFLNRQKAGWPDIDCLKSNHMVVTPNGSVPISDLQVGDTVIDSHNVERRVTFCQRRKSNDDDVVYDLFLRSQDGTVGVIVANHKHRLLTSIHKEITAEDVGPGDLLLGKDGDILVLGKNHHVEKHVDLVDITVEGSSTFWVVPFDSLELTKNNVAAHCCIYTYDLDADAAEGIVAHVQTGESKVGSGITRVGVLGGDQTRSC